MKIESFIYFVMGCVEDGMFVLCVLLDEVIELIEDGVWVLILLLDCVCFMCSYYKVCGGCLM